MASTLHRRRKNHAALVAAGGAAAGALDAMTITGTLTVAEGGTRALTAHGFDRGSAELSPLTVVWTSSNTAVMTVNSSSGVVTAAVGVFSGSATITATIAFVSASVTVAVLGDNVPATVAVSPATATIASAGTQQFTKVVANAAARALSGVAGTWSSSDTGKATINASGLATGVATGTSNINFTTTVGSVADLTPAVLTVS